MSDLFSGLLPVFFRICESPPVELIYFKSTVPNFGDDLNPVVWPVLRPDLFEKEDGRGFVGIGTIIGRKFNENLNLTVFSSGTGYDTVNAWSHRKVKYVCVRGPLSAKLLKLDPRTAITDGAIVLPHVPGFPEKAKGGGRPLIIPHWESFHAPGWDEVARLTGFNLLDPRNEPHFVAETIASASLVLTESLHGAILADLYGVPWSVFIASKNFSVYKWVDWAQSLERTFRATIIPAPHASLYVKYGKRAEPAGTLLTFDEAAAVADPRISSHRGGGSPSLTARLKTAVKQSGLLNPLYGCSPERTAEHLTKLATQVETPTKASLSASRADEMLSRLHALK